MSFPLHGQFSLVACVIFCLTLSSAVNSAPSISAELAESQIVQAQSDVAQRTTIVADQISGTTDTETRATGGVELSKPGVLLKADQLTHTQSRDEADATGNVVLIGVREQISGPHVRLGLTDSIGFFEQPTYEISSSRPPDPLANPAFDQTIVAHGTAERLEFAGKGRYELTNATYSTCKSGANGEIDWFARAGRLNIDQNADLGSGRDVTVYFQGVPILYTPWLSFPLSNQRQSGLLTPTIGSTSKSGFEYTQPYYWNIAPDMDATFSPRLMSKRGVLLGSEFRYLDPSYHGQARYEYLPDDHLTHTNRYAYALTHAQQFAPGLNGSVTMNGVSDDTYFSDLSTRLAVTSQVNLLRQGTLSYAGTWWSATLLSQSFQTLQDPLLPPVTIPYKMLPKFSVNAVRADSPFGAVFSAQGEAVRFQSGTSTDVNGSRFTLYPQVALPMQISALSLTPKVGYLATKYSINNFSGSGMPDHPSISVPIMSVDSTVVFERDIDWTTGPLLQTLEPRVYYVYIPYRNQNQIPVFDTGNADFNFAQMFAENRFAGGDRIGDANQITGVLTSRLIDPATGAEVVRGSFGQRLYFSTQQVGLPGETLVNNRRTDFLGEISLQVLAHTTGTTAWQYNSQLKQTERFNIGLQYRPETGKILNTSYRYTHADSTNGQPGVSQIDVSGHWPLSGNWQAVGRYNYSFQGNRIVEALGGLEYGEGCWAVRFVTQRLATQTQDSTTAFFVQLELNGLSRLGSNPLETLKRSIPGYGIINQPSADPAFSAN